MPTWICNKCKNTFERPIGDDPKQCPDKNCQSKNIVMVHDPRQDLLDIMHPYGIKGAENVVDLIMQKPDDIEHAWKCLSEHGVNQAHRRTILKLYYKKTAEELGLDTLEKGGSLNKNNNRSSFEDEQEAELERKRRRLRELQQQSENAQLDRQIELEMRKQEAMLGFGGNGRQPYNQPQMQPHQNVPTMTIRRQDGWLDQDKKKPNMVTIELPMINPYGMMPFSIPGLQQQPQQSATEIAKESMDLIDKSIEISKKATPPPATPVTPKESQEVKELKDELKGLKEQLSAKEMKDMEDRITTTFNTELAKVKDDLSDKSVEQIQAEATKKTIETISTGLLEELKSFNKKSEARWDAGMDLLKKLVTKKLGGPDEIVSKDELEDEPEPEPLPDPEPEIIDEEIDDDRVPPPRRK